MSEKKTTEIKFRVAPSFKARLQQAADSAGETMSAYLEKAVEERQKNERCGGIGAYVAAPPLSNSTVVTYKGVATHVGNGAFSFNPPLPRDAVPTIESEKTVEEEIDEVMTDAGFKSNLHKPCSDCGELLAPHTSHCGTCKWRPFTPEWKPWEA